jgi:hypothetical protein
MFATIIGLAIGSESSLSSWQYRLDRSFCWAEDKCPVYLFVISSTAEVSSRIQNSESYVISSLVGSVLK